MQQWTTGHIALRHPAGADQDVCERAGREQGAELRERDAAAGTGAYGSVGGLGVSVMKLILFLKNTLRAVVLLACACASVNAFTQTITSVQTVLVEKSTEEIPIPFPSIDNLPRTISFDSLTDQEVQMIRQDIYNHPQFAEERVGKVNLTRPNCMQWMFKKGAPKGGWQPIGFFINGDQGLLNINGKLRILNYAIDVNPESGNPGLEGGLSVWSLHFFKNYSERAENYEKSSGIAMHNYLKNRDGKFWTIGMNNKKLVVANKKMQCSLMNAKCRRYVATMQNIQWRTVLQDQDKWVTLPISRGDGFEIAIEDMCPWRRTGLVETNFRSRIWGEQSGVVWHGFPRNPSLIKALEPYMKSKKEQKK
jgi:hypothetical protein